jgi:hypothetical protein
MNKKLIAFLSILSLSLSLPLIPAYAAVKAGGACKKAGVTSVALGKTYTCVKSGKKLAWNKGRASVATTVQVIPESWPIDKTADKNIFLIADKNLRKFQQANTTTPKVTINYGPTTDKKRADEYLYSMREAAKFWASDWKYDKEVNVAIGTSKDYSWMFQAWSKFGLIRSPEFDSSEKSYTSQGEYCNQGSALLGDDNPFLWGCLSTTGTLEKYGIAGRKFGSHEYTHIAHYGIMGNAGMRNMPVLISEGSADFYGVSLASNSSAVSQDWQTFFSGGFFSEIARDYLKTASSDQVYELLIDSFNKGTKQEGHWYYTGAYATIRMVAAQGHDGFVRFMKSVAETSNANQSFEKIYEIKFEDFAKIIAPEISVLAKTIRNR